MSMKILLPHSQYLSLIIVDLSNYMFVVIHSHHLHLSTQMALLGVILNKYGFFKIFVGSDLRLLPSLHN